MADTYVAALRFAFQGVRADSPDMSAVARTALGMLDEDLVLQAATTHLTQLARREWNRLVTEGGMLSPHSDEVVVVAGQDVLLGDTDEVGREWLAEHRERLADGLKNRARQFREMGAAGPSTRILTQAEVLRAERRADQQEALASTLRALTEGFGTGESVIERRIAEQITVAQERRDEALQTLDRYVDIARQLVDAQFIGRRTTQAIARVAGVLDDLAVPA